MALLGLWLVGCVGSVGEHVGQRPDAGGSGYKFPDAGYEDAAAAPRNCKEAMARGNVTDGVVTIDPDGPGGMPALDVYCDMTTAGGGWMLVMASGFTDYANFTNGNNAISPRPNWGWSGGTSTSTAVPTNPNQLGALDFATWPTFGTEFMITSSINHWISCTPGTGSFVSLTEGTVNCQVVRAVASACTTTAPDHFFKYNTGPSLTVGTNRQNLYYLFDSATNQNWPTHDPCGQNQTNQVRNVANPMTAIYLRAP